MTLSEHFLKKMYFSRIIIFRMGNYANWYVWLNLQAFKETNIKNNNVFSWEGRSDCVVKYSIEPKTDDEINLLRNS